MPSNMGTVPSFGGTFPNLGNLAGPLLYPGGGVPSMPAVSSAPMQCYFIAEDQAPQNGRLMPLNLNIQPLIFAISPLILTISLKTVSLPRWFLGPALYSFCT